MPINKENISKIKNFLAATDAKSLEKMKQLLTFVDEDVLSRKEFTENFAKVLKFLTGLKEKNQGEFTNLNKNMSDLSKKIKGDNLSDLTITKSEINKLFSGLSDKLGKLVDDKIASVRDGFDGKDADEERVSIIASERALESVTPLIPTTKGIKRDILKMGKLLRKALKKKLKISDIIGLKEALKKQGVHSLSGGSGGIGGSIRYYDLSASLDGTTRTFTLPAFARVVDVKLSSVPVMREDTDYTINGSTFQITFTSEISDNDISSGQSCWILYSQM